MKEHEAKYPIDNPDKIIGIILKMGATCCKRTHQIDRYFKSVQPNEISTLSKQSYLRIRQEQDDCFVSLHIREGVYDWEEIQIRIDDPNSTEKILMFLGAKRDVTVEKIREIYSLNNYKIMIDNVIDLGWFIEIEAISKEQLIVFCSSLGFPTGEKDQLRDTSYCDLIRKRTQ